MAGFQSPLKASRGHFVCHYSRGRASSFTSIQLVDAFIHNDASESNTTTAIIIINNIETGSKLEGIREKACS